MTARAEQQRVDWLEALRVACERSSQAEMAERLGVSTTMVSQALSGRYPASLRNLEQRVRGELLARTVECPALGEISLRRCQDEQRRPFAATSHLRVRTYLACRKCEHARSRP